MENPEIIVLCTESQCLVQVLLHLLEQRFCFVFKKKDKNSQRYSLNNQDKTKTVLVFFLFFLVFLSASFFPFPIEYHQKVAHLKVSLTYHIPDCLANVYHLTPFLYPHGYHAGFLAAVVSPAHSCSVTLSHRTL